MVRVGAGGARRPPGVQSCAVPSDPGPSAAAAAQRRDWEELGELDPLWAVVSNPDKRYGRWDIDAFFATGASEVEVALGRAAELGVPAARRAALDFGCGVGRASRALAAHFDEVVGVDISTAMLARGRELNADVGNLEFVHNEAEDLRSLGDCRFDLVYTRLVLQHQSSTEAVRRYIAEFVRLLAPGGAAVFQIPDRLPMRYRMLLARRAYHLLRALGVPPRILYGRLRLHPIRMLWVPERQLRAWVADTGAEVLAVDHKTASSGVRHAMLYVRAPEDTED